MQLDEARNSYHWGLSSKHVAILYVSETMFAFVEEKEEVCFFFSNWNYSRVSKIHWILLIPTTCGFVLDMYSCMSCI